LITFDENDAADLSVGGRHDRSGRRDPVAFPPIEGPVPLGRRRHGWQSI